MCYYKPLNLPSTQNTMSQIIDRYSSQTLTKRECNDSQKNGTQHEKNVSNLVKCDEDTEIQMVEKHAKV